MEKMLQALLSEIQKISRSETVIGQPITCGDAVIVPISRVHIGFGAGTTGNGTNDDAQPHTGRFQGAGSGGGIRVEPVACVVVDKTGRAQLLQLMSNPATTVEKVIDLVPEVMERLGLQKAETKKSTESKKSADR